MWGWIIGIIVAILVLWRFSKIVAALVTPPEISGAIYLKKKFNIYGIDIGKYGNELIPFLVNQAIKVAKMKKMFMKDSFHAAFVDHLEGIIYTVGEYDAGRMDEFLGDGDIFKKLRSNFYVKQEFEK